MAKSFVQELGERLASVESRLSSLSSGNRLDHASLDGTTLYLRDYDGNLSGRLGRQPDGSNGVHVVKVQPPPQLTAALLTVGEQAGTCLTEWDGNTFDGRRMPLIHGHTEIWAELVGEDWSPTVAPGEPAKRVGTIRDRTGGEVVVALPQAGTWAVWLRAMGADRETAGPWSPVATVEIKPLVDTEAIEAELEDARDRITEADERLTAGQETLTGNLETLDERQDALDATLTSKASSSQLDAISNGVAALTGTSAKTFIQGEEPPPMTGAVTYEWAGTPHASESVKRVDGVEVARNLVPNPSFETGVDGFDWYSTSNVSVTTGYSPPIGGRSLLIRYSDEGGWGQRINLNWGFNPSSHAGKFAAVSSMVRRGAGNSTRVRHSLYFGPSSGWTYGTRHLNGSSWRRVSEAVQIPDGADRVQIVTQVYPESTAETPDPVGVLWNLDGYHVAIADTEAEALAQVESYFDGDTPDVPAESGLWINTAEDDARYWWDHEQGAWVEVLDDAVFNRVVADRIFANLGVYDRLQSREGWIGGVALENGAVKSRSVDTEEFFAAEAVIQKVWTDIVRSRLVESQGIITEDMIATGAITTPKLTVTEEMVGEVAKLIRIEAGSLASNDIEAMRIVSSLIEATTYLIHDADGDVSVRLDGVANYIAGRLRAGMSENSSISLDYGEKVRFSGLNEEGEPDPQRVISTPYLNFHTTNVTYQDNREPSIHLDRDDPSGRDGMMIINPGYTVGTDAFRGKLNVVGDVQSNRVEARERATAGQGFEVPHDDDNLVTRLYRESWSDNTYLLGRHHGASQSRARDSFWASSQYDLESGGLRRRVFTWGAPPPTGVRRPILSVHLTSPAAERNAYIVANSSHLSATGYHINEHNPSDSRATYWIYQLAIWEA